MIVDMATSAIAFGKILHAKETGKPIGHGLALDKEGHITTDPHKIENLLPFGGHKVLVLPRRLMRSRAS